MSAPCTTDPTESPARRLLIADQAMLCCLVLVTTLALFGLKIYIACRDLTHDDIPPGRIWDGAMLPSLGRVLGCSAEDFAVGLGCLLVALVLVRLMRAL